MKCVTPAIDPLGAITMKVEDSSDSDIQELTSMSVEAEQDELSYMSACPSTDTFCQYDGMPSFFIISIYQSVHINQIDILGWRLVMLLTIFQVIVNVLVCK